MLRLNVDSRAFRGRLVPASEILRYSEVEYGDPSLSIILPV